MNLRFSCHVELREKKSFQPAKSWNFCIFIGTQAQQGQLRYWTCYTICITCPVLRTISLGNRLGSHFLSPKTCMSAQPTLSPAEAEAALLELNQDLNRLQRAIRLAIQKQLSKMVGRSFDELSQNRQFAESVHELLDSHGLRVRCLECGHPAILRVSPRGKGSGVFVFDHTIEGKRTFHGGRGTVPIIRLVAKPPRKNRQHLPKNAAG